MDPEDAQAWLLRFCLVALWSRNHLLPTAQAAKARKGSGVDRAPSDAVEGSPPDMQSDEMGCRLTRGCNLDS